MTHLSNWIENAIAEQSIDIPWIAIFASFYERSKPEPIQRLFLRFLAAPPIKIVREYIIGREFNGIGNGHLFPEGT